MKSGYVKIRNGIYYAVITYRDKLGNRKQKWISTGLKERGNKKNAKAILEQELENFNEEDEEKQIQTIDKKNISFVEYLDKYVKDKENNVSPSTFEGYQHLNKIMFNYFGKNIKLKDITYNILLDFYKYLREERNLKNISIKRYKEILSPALRLAYRDNLIEKNPYEFMPKLKREKSKRDYYNHTELDKLFEITDKSPIALIVRVAAYYGFRRSEVLGLRWQSIDFDNKTITVENKVLNIRRVLFCSPVLKTLSSYRTLPLLPEFEVLLTKKKMK